MSHRFIYDPDCDECYIPESLQCEKCNNEAVHDGSQLCEEHQEEEELDA